MREPLKPDCPALAQDKTLPLGSVSVINVLLKVDCTYARPRGTDLRSRLRPLLFVAGFRSAMSLLCPPYPTLLFRLTRQWDDYFFAAALRLPATVRRAPRFVRAFVFVLCPCTGSPRRCRTPR